MIAFGVNRLAVGADLAGSASQAAGYIGNPLHILADRAYSRANLLGAAGHASQTLVQLCHLAAGAGQIVMHALHALPPLGNGLMHAVAGLLQVLHTAAKAVYYLTDLISCSGGGASQTSDLVSHHSKPAALLTGPCGLNGSIQGQQVGLLRDGGDHGNDLGHFLDLTTQTLNLLIQCLFGGFDHADLIQYQLAVAGAILQTPADINGKPGNLGGTGYQFGFQRLADLLGGAGNQFGGLRQLFALLLAFSGNALQLRGMGSNAYGRGKALGNTVFQLPGKGPKAAQDRLLACWLTAQVELIKQPIKRGRVNVVCAVEVE